MKQLKKNKRPVVLTVKGKAAAVVQDAKRTSVCSTLPLTPMPRRASGRTRGRKAREGAASEGIFRRLRSRGMAYLVNVTDRAGRDLAHLYREIHANNTGAALKWYRGFRIAISQASKRSREPLPVTPEKRQGQGFALREQASHFTAQYIEYWKRRSRVEVLHIRHGARRRCVWQVHLAHFGSLIWPTLSH